MSRRFFIAALCVLSLVALLFVPRGAEARLATTIGSPPTPARIGSGEVRVAARAEARQQAEALWYATVLWNATVAWNDAVARNAAEQAAAAAAASRSSRTASSTTRSAPAPARSTSGGACTGFVIPDYIIQRESGGNPNAYNRSGAWGCAQTLLSHYSGKGACAGLDPYTIDGQRQCVDRLSDGGRNLDPWAQTR